MKIFDYETPPKAAAVNWGRRYRIAVPIISGLHLCIVALVLGDRYDFRTPRLFPFNILYGIGGFPLFFIVDQMVGALLFCGMALIDALLWGFCAVGLWQALSLARKRWRSKSV